MPLIVAINIISLSDTIDLILNPPKILASTALDHFRVLKLNEIIPDRFAANTFLLFDVSAVYSVFLIGKTKSSS